MPGATVVYVHGLWSSHADSFLLRRRLARDFGLEAHVFRYPSVRASMPEVTERLAEFVRALRPKTLHLIGHSLGGLVIYRCLERFPLESPGRVVFLGTPALGCRAAVEFARLPLARALVGRCVREELLVERERRWRSDRPLGIIAGNRALGFGRLIVRYDGESDGTIAVSETRMPGATDHITVAAGHMGLLVSEEAARQTGFFLRDGHFSVSRADPASPFTSARSP
ncbi:MAG TPA: alpha/beta fold hydrolase [Steroidobacteraceae bacterium]|nr:alpha/beta fold hydrolase [Steroidobacteraceae bacterium]